MAELRGLTNSQPLISIVVPTLNESKYLPRLLSSIRSQSYKNFELIISDDMSSDKTLEIALRSNAKVITNKRLGEYSSRNVAAHSAEGDILVFTGADVVWPHTILEDVARLFSNNPSIVLAYCATFPYDGPLWGKLEYLLYYKLARLITLISRRTNASTAFMAVKSEIFQKVGGFESSYGADSKFSRTVSKLGHVRSIRGERVWVSARRLKSLGFFGFNRYNFLLFIYVFLPALTKTGFYQGHIINMYANHFPPIRSE